MSFKLQWAHLFSRSTPTMFSECVKKKKKKKKKKKIALPLTHWVLAHIKMWSWYNNSWLDFLKNSKSIMYQKKEKNILQKNEPSFVTVKCCDGSLGIILGEIICEYSNWQHIQRLKITILGANSQLFVDGRKDGRTEGRKDGRTTDATAWHWKGLPNVHILFCLHKTSSFTDL